MIEAFVLLNPITSYIWFGLLCISIGSLLNVIIYRLPLMLKARWCLECSELLNIPQKKQKTINLFYPRSFCVHCKHQIPFWHNIPLFSYLFLRGRCHACHKPISLQYPLIELTYVCLCLFAAWHFGFNLKLVYSLLFIGLVICLSVIDFKQQLLPDSLNYALIWLGLIANIQSTFTSLPNAVLSAVVAYHGLLLFTQLYYLVTKKTGMGNGDFKLYAAFGAWFGWTQLPLILLVSSLTGATVGIIYLRITHQSKETPIPFGPFLCLAGLISLFYGPEMIQWYITIIAKL